MALINALLARITAALPTEAELAQEVENGLAWWDNFLDNTNGQ